MRTDRTRAQSSPLRHTWHTLVAALLMLTGAFSIAGFVAATAAQASTMVVDQCNTHGPATEGATTAMKCTVTVVNTMSEKSTSSTTTVTRLCTLGPCSTPNGTFTTKSPGLVTAVKQCNESDNDAAHAIDCSVEITNNITGNTQAPSPMTASTVNQCVGSGSGSNGKGCTPAHAASSGASVNQCNGSGNGGGGTVHCTVDPKSTVSSAIPVTVNQCNGSGNVGGSAVTCKVSLVSHIIKPVGTDTDDGTLVPATDPPTAAPTPSATATHLAQAAPPAQPQTASSDGSHTGLYMLGAALVLAGSLGTLLFRRYAGKADHPND